MWISRIGDPLCFGKKGAFGIRLQKRKRGSLENREDGCLLLCFELRMVVLV